MGGLAKVLLENSSRYRIQGHFLLTGGGVVFKGLVALWT